MSIDANEFEYIEYLSKRVADRAIKQVRGFIKELKDEMRFNMDLAKRLVDRIENENRRTLDIRAEFTELECILKSMKTDKLEIFERIRQYEVVSQCKFNRITDAMIEINELKEEVKVLKRIVNHG